MTFFYPDVSNHNAGLMIQPNTAVVCAKSSEGVDYRDPTYPGFRSQAAKVGALFVAYHWTWCANVEAEAHNALSMVGKDTPMMWDVENLSRMQSVAGILALTNAYRRLGGRVTMCYLPRWYWERMGSPDLRPLRDAGLALVSSNYRIYSDNGPGWDSYGGWQPYVWQYSDSQPYGGKLIDFNACKDSLAGFTTRIMGRDDGMADLTEIGRVADNGDRWGLATVTGTELATFRGSDNQLHTTPNVLHEKLDGLKTAVEGVNGAGLTDADRKLVTDLLTAVRHLSAQLQAAGTAQ